MNLTAEHEVPDDRLATQSESLEFSKCTDYIAMTISFYVDSIYFQNFDEKPNKWKLARTVLDTVINSSDGELSNAFLKDAKTMLLNLCKELDIDTIHKQVIKSLEKWISKDLDFIEDAISFSLNQYSSVVGSGFKLDEIITDVFNLDSLIPYGLGLTILRMAQDFLIELLVENIITHRDLDIVKRSILIKYAY